MWKILLLLGLFTAAKSGRFQDVSADQIIQIYSTTKANPGFNLKQANFNAAKDANAAAATINAAVKHQKIIGFGGTFTDATGINLNKLSKEVREQVIDALFSDNGIGINLCRVPIGGTEYSTRQYTLDDHDGDITLKQFALQTEDLVDKIPIIKAASALRKNLKLFASAWTAPIWMKDHKVWMGYSMLSDKYGQVYSDYLKRFLDEYEKQGVKMWGITTGNVPILGFRAWEPNTMGWLPDLQVNWIKQHFGPTIRNSTHKDIVIIGHDDSAESFGYFVPTYVEDAQVMKYLDGLATHWYMNSDPHPTVNEFAQNSFKELFLLSTDTNYGKVTPVVGNWDKALKILGIIFTKLEWNNVGWVDYNLVLNAEGGPSHSNVHSDAPIILSADLKTFTKTPAYFVLGHFSKFVLPGSVRIDVSLAPARPRVSILAFLRPDNVKVVTIYNANLGDVKIQLHEGTKYSQVIDVPGQSLHTLLYS